MIISIATLQLTLAIAGSSTLSQRSTNTVAQTTRAPFVFKSKTSLSIPQDPSYISIGLYTITFSDFENPFWSTNDILILGFDMHQDLQREQTRSGSGLDDSIPNGAYYYANDSYDPPVSFSFDRDRYTATRDLTFRDMYSVLNALRIFTKQWGMGGSVPAFDVDLVVGGSSTPSRQGAGMLISMFNRPAAMQASKVNGGVSKSQIDLPSSVAKSTRSEAATRLIRLGP